MTTNTTPSTASQAPAVSIDTPEFRNLLQDARAEPESNAKQSRLIAHIDAKLAQAREEAIGALAIAFEKMLCAAVGRDWSTSGISASSLVEELRSCAEKAEARATAAEAKLEAIQQKLSGYVAATLYDEHGNDFYVDDFAAILLPQPKADESRLPG